MRRLFHIPAVGRPDTFAHIAAPVFPLLPSVSSANDAVSAVGLSGFPASHHIDLSICARSCGLACTGSLMLLLRALLHISAPVDENRLPVLSYPWRTPLWWVSCSHSYLTTVGFSFLPLLLPMYCTSTIENFSWLHIFSTMLRFII